MSVSASIDINLNKSNCKSYFEILRSLSNYGWTFIHNNRLTYSFLNKEGDLDFQAVPLTLEQFVTMVQQKSSQYVLIAVEMTWQDSGIGGPLAFRPDEGFCKISLWLESHRQKINLSDSYEMTDFQWYLERLLLPLEESFGIASFSCEQIK